LWSRPSQPAAPGLPAGPSLAASSRPGGHSRPEGRRAPARPAPAHAGAAARGGCPAGRRRRQLVHMAGAGQADQRQRTGPGRGGADPAARWRRALASVLARRGHAAALVGEDVVPGAVSDVLRSLDPLPAVLINGRSDVVDTNDAHGEMFWDWHSLPCVHKNLLWCHGHRAPGAGLAAELRQRDPAHDRPAPRGLRPACRRSGVGGGHSAPGSDASGRAGAGPLRDVFTRVVDAAAGAAHKLLPAAWPGGGEASGLSVPCHSVLHATVDERQEP
jgi:hypothetical protein